MKGKDIIKRATSAEMPDMEQMKENCIRQAQNQGKTKRNVWVKRTATVGVCFVLVFSMMFALPFVWNSITPDETQTLICTTPPPEPPFLSFPNITPLTVRASRILPESTIGGYGRPGPHIQWSGHFAEFSLDVQSYFPISLRELGITGTAWSSSFGDKNWYIWVRIFDETTMIQGTEYGGGWQQICLWTAGLRHEASQWLGGDGSTTLGFDFRFCWFMMSTSYRSWNYNVIDFQLGATYEYMISLVIDGENRFTSYSETFEICEISLENVALFYELHQATSFSSAHRAGFLDSFSSPQQFERWLQWQTERLTPEQAELWLEEFFREVELHGKIYAARVAFVSENLERFMRVDSRFERLLNGDINGIWTPTVNITNPFRSNFNFICPFTGYESSLPYGWFKDYWLVNYNMELFVASDFCDHQLLDYWALLEYNVSIGILCASVLEQMTVFAQIVQDIAAARR